MMYNSWSKVVALVILVFGLPLSLIAATDDVDSLRHYQLKDFVVMGVKEQMALETRAISATSISARAMETLNITSVKDFAGVVPNFLMVDRDTPHTSSVLVRGMGSLLKPAVVMYVDGVPHFEKSTFDISLNDVEKIEFLRGPQGTTFGRNAIGGIILVQTRSPFKYHGTGVKLNYNMTYPGVLTSVAHQGSFNDHWAYSLSGHYKFDSGYIPNDFDGSKADKGHLGAVAARLEWSPNRSTLFRLKSSADFVRQGAFTYGELDPETGYTSSVALNYPSQYTRRIFDNSLQFSHQASSYLMRGQVSAQYYTGLYDVDQDGSAKDMYQAQQGEKQLLLSQELSVMSKSEGRYQWSFGFFSFQQKMDRAIDVLMKLPNGGKVDIHRDHDELAWAVSLYHQSTLQLGERFNIEAGLRYDYERARQFFTETKNGHEMKDNNTLPFSHFTPKLSLQYLLAPESHLYAIVTQGYTTGGFSPLYKREEARTYGAEMSWNYEVGAKGWILPKRLYGELALFVIDTRDKQLKKLIDGVGVNTYNSGRALSKGVEAALTAHLSSRWQVNAAYGYTHAVFTDYVYNDKVDYTGNFVPLVPRHTIAANTQYELPIKGSRYLESLRFNLGYKGIGSIYWHEDNQRKQELYHLLDASVTANMKALTCTLWGSNLLNTKYLGYSYTSLKRQMGKPGRPFMMGLSLNYSF